MPTLEDLLGSTAAWTPNVSAAPDAVPMPSLPSLPTLPGSQPTLESQPAPQMPQWAPAVNAPEPQVRPQPRPAQPGNRAEQIRQIASLLMPLIVGTIATSKGGALAGAAAMSGANQANALAMNQRRQDALWAQQEQDRQAQIGARLAEVETQRQRNRSAFVTDAFAAVNAITDPVEHQQTVEQLDQAGAEQWGLRPGWLKRSAVFSDSRRATAIKKEADALLSKLEASDNLGDALKDAKGWDMAIEFSPLGRSVTLRELAQFAGRPQKADGTYLLAGKGSSKRVWVTTRDKSGKQVRRYVTEDEAASQPWELEPMPKSGGGSFGTAGGGALTPDALNLMGTLFRTTGQMPALGMGSQGRIAVANEAGRQARASGTSAEDVIAGQAGFKGDSAALVQTKKQLAAAQSFESKARGQAQIVLNLSNAVPRTQYPVINRGLLAYQKNIAGDSATQRFYNAVLTFTTEYAKIMTGSTGSASASTDAARREAAELISTALNEGTIADTVALMQREMDLTIEGYQGTIGEIQDRMRGSAGGQAPGAAQTGRTITVGKYKVRIR